MEGFCGQQIFNFSRGIEPDSMLSRIPALNFLEIRSGYFNGFGDAG